MAYKGSCGGVMQHDSKRNPVFGEAQPLGADDIDLITPEYVSGHGLVLIEGVPNDPVAILDIANRLGESQRHIHGAFHVPGYPELVKITNMVRDDGKPAGIHNSGELEWHIDSSWAATPNKYSLMYCELSTGDSGATWFSRLDDAYDRLPVEQQEALAGLTATHSLNAVNERKRAFDATREPLTDEQRGAAPDVEHPLVSRHPITQRNCLRIGNMVVSRVNGLDADSGAKLIDNLVRAATRDEHIYKHVWRDGQVVAWDNLTLLHTATPTEPGDMRSLYRATID